MSFILLITHSRDFYTIDKVEQHLRIAGYQTIRFNVDQYPTQVHLDFQHMNGGCVEKYLHINGNEYPVDQIKGIWYRRLWKLQMPDDLDPEYASYCTNEASTHLQNFLHLMEDSLWLDPLHLVERAGNKLYQTEQARRVNMPMPATLVSNNPQRIESFFYQVNGKMITKMQTVLSVTMGGNGAAFRTSKVEEADLKELQSVQYCPMIFQEEVAKLAEYRVVYVDGQFFCGKILNEELTSNSPDIKSNSQVNWRIGDLPAALKIKVTHLMQNLELQFGVMDFVETPDHSFVFLEVNPIGEWGMLEKELNLPISHAIAQTLIRKIKQYEESTYHHTSER